MIIIKICNNKEVIIAKLLKEALSSALEGQGAEHSHSTHLATEQEAGHSDSAHLING
jgi:hypothetical protein